MEGTRSSNNCYILTNDLLCCSIKLDDFELCHQTLGNVNYRDRKRLQHKRITKKSILGSTHQDDEDEEELKFNTIFPNAEVESK